MGTNCVRHASRRWWQPLLGLVVTAQTLFGCGLSEAVAPETTNEAAPAQGDGNASGSGTGTGTSTLTATATGTGTGTDTGGEPADSDDDSGADQDDDASGGEKCQPGKIVETIDCHADVPFSSNATRKNRCSDDGLSVEVGACVAQGCLDGYDLTDGECVSKRCDAGTPKEIVSCVDEIAHSAEATKAKTCDVASGDFEYGDCELAGCAPSYYQFGNECLPQACTPGEAGSVSCATSKPGSQVAIQTRTCNELGSDYVLSDDCTVGSCASGFHKVGNSCVANACEPNADLGTVSCIDEIPASAEATKTKACDSEGTGYVYGTCQLVACESGNHAVGNSCVADICTPGAVDSVNCTDEIPFSAAATKSRTCVGGESYSYGSCVATSCASGYTLVGNSCVATYPQLAASTASQDQQINLTLGAFPLGVDEIKIYRFTSAPPTSFWQCTTSCKQIATFKPANSVMTGSFSWVDTLPAAGTTYWYRYVSTKSGTSRNDLATASAASAAAAIAYRHVAFLTSTASKAGALGGLTGADAKCAAAASSAGLTGTNFRAVIASSSEFAWERADVLGPVKNLIGNLLVGTEVQLAHGLWATDEITTEGSAVVSTSTAFWLGNKTNNCGLWNAADTADIVQALEASGAQPSWKGLTTNTSSGTCNWTGFTIPTKRLLCIGDL